MTRDELVHLIGVVEDILVGELVVHILVLLQQVHDRLHAFTHDVDHGLGLVQVRLLLQVADGIAGAQVHIAIEVLVLAGDDAHQRGLTRSVETEYPDLGSVVEPEVDIVEDLLSGRQGLAHLHHIEDYLTSFFCHGRCVGTGLWRAAAIENAARLVRQVQPPCSGPRRSRFAVDVAPRLKERRWIPSRKVP